MKHFQRMKNILFLLISCFCASTLSSCGSIMTCLKERERAPALTITSNVPDADVYINGKYVGKTPYSHFGESNFCDVKKIKVCKDGYKSESKNPRKLNGWAYVNFVPYPLWNWIWGYFYDTRKKSKCWEYKNTVFNFNLEEDKRR